MTPICDVLIIGGGVVGLTTALALAQRDYQVAIVDSGTFKLPDEKPDLRVYAINQASQQLFKQLGVWEFFNPANVSPYQHMHVWDAANQACIDFDARMVASNELGAIIDEATIKRALLQKIVDEKKIHCFPSSRVDRVEPGEELISVFSGENNWTSRLLIVADGGESPTRQLLKVPITTWPYHQHALVATVYTEKPHEKTAYQVFNKEGPLAFLPLNDPQQCSIVWSTTPQQAQRLTSMEETDFNQALNQAFAGKLGNVQLMSKRHQFPLIMRHAKNYAGKNWLLMGDAAHTIHPLAGLGLNVGLADLAAWLNILDSTSSKIISKKMLGTYQRQRKYNVWQLIMLLQGLKSFFANPLSPIVAIRGLGISACNQLTPIKKLFIDHAAGL